METKEFVAQMDQAEAVARGQDLPKKAERGQNFFLRYIEKRKAEGNAAVTAVLCFGFLLLGFLFAKTTVLFGAIPLGVGLLCAKKEKLPEVTLGVALGLLSLGMAGLVYGAVGAVALLIRFGVSVPGEGRRFLPDCKAHFHEAPELRVATATLSGVLIGGYQLLAGGITTPSLLFGLGMVLLTPLSAVAFMLAFEDAPALENVVGLAPMPQQSRKEKLLWQAGSLLLLMAVTFALRGVELFGISLALTFAAAVTFFAGKRFGGIHGMVTGLATGVAVLPLYAPAFGLAGLLSGVLWSLGGFFALGLGVAAGAVWSSFIGGLTGFLTVFPEISLAAVALLPALKKVKKDDISEEEQDFSPAAMANAVCFVENATEEETDTEEKMLKLSSALASLTKLYQNFRQALTAPKLEASLSTAHQLCTKRCEGCAHHAGCWGDENKGEEGVIQGYIATAVDKLYRGEPLEGLELPAEIKNACAVPDAILEDARTAVGEWMQSEDRREDGMHPTLAYEAAASMLRDIVRAERGRKHENPKQEEQLKTALRRLGVSCKWVSVRGQKQKTVQIGGVRRKLPQDTAEQLQETVETLCGGKFSPFAVLQNEGEWVMEAHSVKKYTAETAVVMRSALPEQVSGDTVRCYEKQDGQFCVVLSDGMGSGQAAAAVSGLCASFLQKLMEAGCHRTTAVKLLNQTIRSASDVGSTTLDLAEIDLLHGDVTFLKAGASASYVKRGTQLFRIRSKTIPLGLMSTPDTEKTRFHLEAGDVVVLLSDGISQMPEDSPALCALLAADWGEQSLQESAGHILSAALSSGERADDMTVVLVRVS